MKRRAFGRTGIQVSEVIFGAGAVGGILVHKDDATKREAIRIFAAGIIASDERTGRKSVRTSGTSVTEDERKSKALFDAIGTGQGTRAQVALRFVLSNPDVSAAVIGRAELRDIDEALQAAEMGPLPPQVRARLDALYESDFGPV